MNAAFQPIHANKYALIQWVVLFASVTINMLYSLTVDHAIVSMLMVNNLLQVDDY